MQFRRPIFQSFLSLFHRADSAFNHVFTEKGNFLYYLGALPVILLFVLLITGLFMFIYYNMSVHQSYESVKYMTESALLGRFVRNLHRYAADAMMFFVLLHMARMLFEEKFQNHRTLAWVSGLIILGFMLVQGLTGYILPLDANARFVMEKTSELLAGLRVFGDTLPRSFSSPALLGKWIMWVVLIVHLFIPLLFILLLFVHLLRVSRAKLFPPRKLTLAFLGVLVVYTLVFPINMVGKAEAERMPELLQPDWFYLFFAAVFESRFGWIAWSTMAVGFLLLLALPWLFKKREIVTAAVITDKCTGCGLCAIDCPYQAMHMVTRTVGGEATHSPHKFLVSIDTDLCSGCGICAGSCTYDAITHVKPGAPQTEPDWSDARDKWVALVCQGRAHSLGLNADGGALRDYEAGTVLAVTPCTGKLGVSETEKIRAGGAKGLIIGACPDGDCWYREGNRWLMDRIELKRKPNFRRVPGEFPILGYRFNGQQRDSFLSELRQIVTAQKTVPNRLFALLKPSNWAQSFSVGTLVFALATWVFYLGSSGRFGAIEASKNTALLRLDFFYQSDKETCSPDKIPADAHEQAIKRMAGLVKLENLTPEARERILQQATDSVASKYCSRARRDLDITVTIDGQQHAKRTFRPSGFQRDGITYVMMKVQTVPGSHNVQVEVNERDTGSVGKRIDFSEKMDFAAAEVKLLDYEPNQAKLFRRTLQPSKKNETGKE
ncbi:MAG: cytochrome b N-terminal domain-containing protein [Spirochaetota bacterium]